MRRLLRGLLLLATAGLIAKLMLTGQMALYMSPALDPLTVATGAVLAGMGAHEVWAAVRDRPLGAGQNGHGSMTDEALSYLLVLVPVGLGLLTAPRALDPNALGGQDAGRVVIAYSTTPASSAAGPPEQPIRDVPDLFRYLRTAAHTSCAPMMARTAPVAAVSGSRAGLMYSAIWPVNINFAIKPAVASRSRPRSRRLTPGSTPR